MLRVILPAVNLVLQKCGQLFCGEPSTTLKVGPRNATGNRVPTLPVPN